jgi:hypothetical protein
MAELADALASGASGSNIVEVRVLLAASYLQKEKLFSEGFSFCFFKLKVEEIIDFP